MNVEWHDPSKQRILLELINYNDPSHLVQTKIDIKFSISATLPKTDFSLYVLHKNYMNQYSNECHQINIYCLKTDLCNLIPKTLIESLSAWRAKA